MAQQKYYGDLYEIDDYSRRKKYQELLLASLLNDMPRWTQKILNSGTPRYSSPDYNGEVFNVEVGYSTYAYVKHSTPVAGHPSELICSSPDIPKEIKSAISTLMNTIFTNEIYEIEKLIGNKHSRKEKLDVLEIGHVKEIIDDTYNDFIQNMNEVTAEMVAKIMYAYRRNEEISELWKEKFKDHQIIFNELKKLTG